MKMPSGREKINENLLFSSQNKIKKLGFLLHILAIKKTIFFMNFLVFLMDKKYQNFIS